MRGVEILEIFSWNREKDFLILITLKTGEMTLLNIVDNVIDRLKECEERRKGVTK